MGQEREPSRVRVGDRLLVLVEDVIYVAIAVLLWNTGVSLVGVPVASLFANSAPVFAIGLAALFGHEPTWLQLVGGVIVLGGIGQLQLRQMRAARSRRPSP